MKGLKKTFAIALSLAMILAFMSIGVMTAYAENESGNVRVYNGDTFVAGYDTLGDAVSAAESGNTVKLFADVTNSSKTSLNKSITLDLNGFSITSTAVLFEIYNSSVELTIKDSGENGAINVSADKIIYASSGKVTLAGGSLSNSGSGSTYTKGVDVGSSGSFEMTDGSITIPSTSSSSYNYCVSNSGSTNISGGTLTAEASGGNYAVSNSAGTVEVTGGTVVAKASTAGWGYSPYVIYVQGGTAVVEGGYFKAIGDKDAKLGGHLTYGNVSVNGGYWGGSYYYGLTSDVVASGYMVRTMTSEEPDETDAAACAAGYKFKVEQEPTYVAQIGDVGYPTLADAVAAVGSTETTILMIGDETIVGNAGVTIPDGKNIILDLNGKTISQTQPDATTGYLIKNQGTLTITDGSQEGTGKLTAVAQNPDPEEIPGYANNTISNYGSLTVQKGTIENTSTSGYAHYGIDNYSGGNLSIEGGTILNMQDYNYPVRMFLSSTTASNDVNISGGTIIGGYGLWIQYANGDANKASLTITGGTFISDDGTKAVYGGRAGGGNRDTSNIDILITGGTVGGDGAWLGTDTAFKSIAVSGGNFESLGASGSAGSFITGGYYNEDCGKYCKSGFVCIANPDDNKDKYAYKVVKAKTYVAQIGTTQYETLAEAVDAAEPTDTIELLTDIELSAYVSIAKPVTIDLKGHSITRPAESGNTAFLVSGNLTVKDTASNSSAAIVASANPIYMNGGTLTVKSGNIGSLTDSTYGILGSGTITVESGTVNGSSYGLNCWDGEAPTTVNVTGGTINSGNWGIAMFDESTLNFSGGTINADSMGICTNGNTGENANINISGGTIGGTTVPELGIYQPSGKLNIKGGTINGETGVYFKSNSLNISDGNVNGTGADDAYKYNGNGADATGDALVIDSCGYPNGINDVAITGGNFSSEHAKAVACYTYSTNTPVEGFITGGKYSSEPDSGYVAEGHKAVGITGATYKYQVGVATTTASTTGDLTHQTVEYTVKSEVKEDETSGAETLESITDLTVTVQGTTTDTETNPGQGGTAAAALNNINGTTVLGNIISDAVDAAGSSITEQTNTANVVIQLAKSPADTSTVGKAVYEVHPEAVIKVNNEPVATIELTDEQITGSFSFRLYCLNIQNVAVGDTIQVTHNHSDGSSEVHGRYTVESDGYIIVTGVTSFSEFELEEVNGGTTDEAEYTYSLALKDSLNIVFYVKNLAHTPDDQNVYTVEYTYKGTKKEATLNSKTSNRIVIAECAAKEMGQPVSVVVKYNGTSIKEASYSVKGYCDYVIGNEYSAKLQNLCKATLDYGRYAQETFGYDTAHLVNGGNDFFVNENIQVPGYNPEKIGTCTGISNVTVALATTSATKLKVRYIADSSSTYTVTVNGEAVTPTAMTTPNKYEISISGIAAKNLADKQTIVIENNNDHTTHTYKVSPVDYMGLAVANNSEVKTNRAFYNYYTYADIYNK